EHIPAFAAQRRAVQAFIAGKQRCLAEKAKEVDRMDEQKSSLHRANDTQYDLLMQGLRIQIEEAKAKSSERRCQLEESLQEEQELSRHLAGQEQSNKALRASLDRTILQMEEVQASILQLEAKTQLGADQD
ncbi:unnamed protein product, partial [Polarella glacialis]